MSECGVRLLEVEELLAAIREPSAVPPDEEFGIRPGHSSAAAFARHGRARGMLRGGAPLPPRRADP